MIGNKKKPHFNKKIFRRLLKYVKPYKLLVFWSVVLTLVVSFLIPIRPYIVKVTIDDFMVLGDIPGVIKMAALFGLVLLAQAVFQLSSTYLTQLLGQRAIRKLRMDVFKHLQKLSLSFFDRNPIGTLITRLTSDVEALNEMLSSGIVALIGNIIQIVFITLLMFFIDWRLTLVMFSVLPIMFFVTMIFKKKIQAAYKKVRSEVARLNTFLQEHITGMAIIKMFNKEEEELEKHKEINAAHRDANIQTIFYFSMFYPAIEVISAVALGLIIWYGAENVNSGAVTIGTVVSFIQYVSMFFLPLQELSDKYNVIQSAIASGDRIFSILDQRQFIPSPTSKQKLKNVRGHICFENVSFSYTGQGNNLKNVSFEVNPGEIMALVGATGSGKSTVVNTLCKLYKINDGSIYLDGINIMDLEEKEIRKHIGIVMQDVFLFSGTLRENITMGEESITQKNIEETAKHLDVHDFILSLPDNYNYKVKERGTGLSAGQKQLIAFLRVMLYNPKILILDEATSAIDPYTERKIEHAMKLIVKGRTTLIIAHRLSSIQNADKIIVLHKGEIKEIGNHEELFNKKGLYYKLYSLQHTFLTTSE